jgi:hypothetical protein
MIQQMQMLKLEELQFLGEASCVLSEVWFECHSPSLLSV